MVLKDLLNKKVDINGKARMIKKQDKVVGFFDETGKFVELGFVKDDVKKVEDTHDIKITLRRIMG